MTENPVESTLFCKKNKVFFWHGAGCTFRANPGIAKSPQVVPWGVIFEAFLFSPYLGR